MHMVERIILLAIKKTFAEEILTGQKLKEYRRRPPRILEPTRTIMLIAGAREIVGEFVMDPPSGERTPWGFALGVSHPRRYSPGISWEELSSKIPGLRPPQQSYRYLQPGDMADLRLMEILEHYRTA
jgi:predicted transcriptional regulator